MSEVCITLHQHELDALKRILDLPQYRNRTPYKLRMLIGSDGVTRALCYRSRRAVLNFSDKHVLHKPDEEAGVDAPPTSVDDDSAADVHMPEPNPHQPIIDKLREIHAGIKSLAMQQCGNGPAAVTLAYALKDIIRELEATGDPEHRRDWTKLNMPAPNPHQPVIDRLRRQAVKLRECNDLFNSQKLARTSDALERIIRELDSTGGAE